MHTHNEIIKYRPLALYACEEIIDLLFNREIVFMKKQAKVPRKLSKGGKTTQNSEVNKL